MNSILIMHLSLVCNEILISYTMMTSESPVKPYTLSKSILVFGSMGGFVRD
jgi:hypothetical protein